VNEGDFIQMRTTTFSLSLISGLAALALAACSGEGGDPSPADVPQGTASAALEAAPQGANAGERHDPAKMIQRFDKNGDGKLEISELPPRMQKFMSKADTNGDGALTLDEMTAARESFIKERFARGDKNGDGALTEDEIGDRKWARISVADTDKSGSVTLPEIEAAVAAGKIHFPHGHGHHFRGNGDATPAPAPSTTKS
jgi:Ca2+-binding EF-hand superfamily protein